MKTKRIAVVIGRFQPVHIFHVQTLLAHACQYDAVLVLLGSSLKATDQKNPFTWVERMNFIRAAAKDLGLDISHVMFKPIKDYPYSNTRWVFQVQKLVEEHCISLEGLSRTDTSFKPVLVGINKDDTSFYLRLFPHWDNDVFEPPPGTIDVSATQVRDAMFQRDWDRMAPMVTPTILNQMREWLDTDKGRRIQEEFDFAKRSRIYMCTKDADGNLVETPYAPTFHTADSVVLWRGHVLLIRRRSFPGKGLWALPGGFINANEWIKAAAVRERQEESKVTFYHKGTKKRLRLHEDWCKADHVFDHPGRSLRGRTITTGFLWIIPDEYEVETEAADDADRAQWFPIYDVLERMDHQLFEDHQSIIAHFALGAFR